MQNLLMTSFTYTTLIDKRLPPYNTTIMEICLPLEEKTFLTITP